MDKSKGYEENRLITSIKLANLRIFEAAQRDSKLRGMGTTMVGIVVVEDGVLIAHVGDSRAYRWRGNKLEQITEDHSLLNDYIKMKRLTPEEIANFPHKNVIVRALGMKETVKVDTRYEKPNGRRHLPDVQRRALRPGQRIRISLDVLIGHLVGSEDRGPQASSTRPTRPAAPTTSPSCSPAGSPDQVGTVQLP
jgi:serine/threonine protein phosphatase PrpC